MPGVTFGAKAMSLFVSGKHADASSKHQRGITKGRKISSVFFLLLTGNTALFARSLSRHSTRNDR